MVEGSVWAIVVFLLISLVLVIIRLCSTKRRDEQSLLEMSPKTPFITTTSEMGLPLLTSVSDDSSDDVSEPIDLDSESGHVDASRHVFVSGESGHDLGRANYRQQQL